MCSVIGLFLGRGCNNEILIIIFFCESGSFCNHTVCFAKLFIGLLVHTVGLASLISHAVINALVEITFSATHF